jgi:hypothetical protein
MTSRTQIARFWLVSSGFLVIYGTAWLRQMNRPIHYRAVSLACPPEELRIR